VTYLAADDRYDTTIYRRCRRSELKLPAISLGLWCNVGGQTQVGADSDKLHRLSRPYQQVSSSPG
jgi:L-glyceraldehyde 3-phosphate reductase